MFRGAFVVSIAAMVASLCCYLFNEIIDIFVYNLLFSFIYIRDGLAP